jgi:GNAT superfamily N-acetyltransferase
MVDGIVTRRASRADFPAVLALLRRALGWVDDDERFLEWKHLQNPFGESPMWVALAGSRVVGFRAFLRWQLVDPDGRVRYAARAVDTATDPEFEGRGIFTRLTLEALDALPAEGVELVFNTPNARSLPGYLKMGWQDVGRLATAVRPTRWRFVTVVGTARRAAGRGFVASAIGAPVEEAFVDRVGVDRLIAEVGAPSGLVTRRSSGYLLWRYGNPDLGYRVLHGGTAAAPEGFLVFRLRRRGSAVEGVVSDVVAPPREPAGARELLDRLARAREADYLIRLQHPRVTRDRFVRLPQVGPVLVCRALADIPMPDLRRWAPSMGDVELL